MPLGKEVGLGPGHIVLDGDAVGSHPTAAHPHFSVRVYCDQTVAHLRNCRALVHSLLLNVWPCAFDRKPEAKAQYT